MNDIKINVGYSFVQFGDLITGNYMDYNKELHFMIQFEKDLSIREIEIIIGKETIHLSASREIINNVPEEFKIYLKKLINSAYILFKDEYKQEQLWSVIHSREVTHYEQCIVKANSNENALDIFNKIAKERKGYPCYWGQAKLTDVYPLKVLGDE